jgi:hypothetical protein
MAEKSNSRCTKQKLQLEVINMDSQLQTLLHRHPESRTTIQHLQDRLGVMFHLIGGVDIERFCSNEFAEGA